MKMRNKGKVHPFTSSSSSSSSSLPPTNTDAFSLLKLLPAAILTLVSFLSLEEREVLAYMITRSLKSPNPSSLPATEDKKKQCGHNSPALFDCDCFHCYTSFWFRWDSSPNRELIHQAIEAFEDHLNSGGTLNNSPKTKRRDKLGRRNKPPADPLPSSPPENQERPIPADLPQLHELSGENAAEPPPSPAAVVRTHKGLARKVLPDVMGIFSSRLWSLWSPNV
ncbi:uncharacterized protein LOC130995653 [Salvia miltiorrhiza]|uniref:uncharacterized protein LOC130995653 n=1 Tax=Salvia miltiorrhiza TaxID=226208 RepID=UPI0025AD4D73|nr:uncharacterized protein LOC130995653 [Salvia miltiorrhiza]